MIQVVLFGHDAEEPITALYIDGKLYREGDEYHHGISHWIRGFIEGYEPEVVEDYEIAESEIGDLAYDWKGAPETFDSIPWKLTKV